MTSALKRLYCLGIMASCVVYSVIVLAVIWAPTMWIVHRMMSR